MELVNSLGDTLWDSASFPLPIKLPHLPQSIHCDSCLNQSLLWRLQDGFSQLLHFFHIYQFAFYSKGKPNLFCLPFLSSTYLLSTKVTVLSYFHVQIVPDLSRSGNLFMLTFVLFSQLSRPFFFNNKYFLSFWPVLYNSSFHGTLVLFRRRCCLETKIWVLCVLIAVGNVRLLLLGPFSGQSWGKKASIYINVCVYSHEFILIPPVLIKQLKFLLASLQSVLKVLSSIVRVLDTSNINHLLICWILQYTWSSFRIITHILLWKNESPKRSWEFAYNSFFLKVLLYCVKKLFDLSFSVWIYYSLEIELISFGFVCVQFLFLFLPYLSLEYHTPKGQLEFPGGLSNKESTF